MKYILTIALLLLAMMAFSQDGMAQRRRLQHPMDGPRPERLEKFRKMRLIEVLKLNEEDAVRFFAKQTAHEDAQRLLLKSRNEALDDIEKMVHDKKDGKDIQKRIDDISGIDQKMFAERIRFHDDVQKVLTPEQFGKLLVFERNFGRQIRDALQDMHEDRREDGHE